jgi:hypothetical protein
LALLALGAAWLVVQRQLASPIAGCAVGGGAVGVGLRLGSGFAVGSGVSVGVVKSDTANIHDMDACMAASLSKRGPSPRITE